VCSIILWFQLPLPAFLRKITFPANYKNVCLVFAYKFTFLNFSVAPGLSQNFWLNNGPPMQNRRKPNSHRVPAEIWNEFERYTQLMRHYQEGEYASLLTADLKLTQVLNIAKRKKLISTILAIQSNSMGAY
jgi:hypothetical protein